MIATTNKMLDAEMEKHEQARQQQLDRNAKKAAQITGNSIWSIASRNNLKPKLVKITDRFGNVTRYTGEVK